MRQLLDIALLLPEAIQENITFVTPLKGWRRTFFLLLGGGGGGGGCLILGIIAFLYIAISWELITLFSSNIADIIVIILVEGDSTKKNHSKFLLLCWGSFCGILRPFWHILLNVLKIAWSFLVKLTTNILGITVMVTTLYFFKVCLCLLELDLVYFLAYFW